MSQQFVPARGVISAPNVAGNMVIVSAKLEQCVKARKQLTENWGKGSDVAGRVGYPDTASLETTNQVATRVMQGTGKLQGKTEQMLKHLSPTIDKLQAMSELETPDFSERVQENRDKIAPILLRLIPHLYDELSAEVNENEDLKTLMQEDLAFLQASTVVVPSSQGHETRARELEVENKRLRRERNEARENAAKLSQQHKETARLAAEQKDNKEQKQSELDELQGSFDGLQEEHTALQGEADDLQARLSEAEGDLVDASNQNDQLITEIEEARQQNSELEQQIQSLEANLQDALGKLPVAREERAKALAQHNQVLKNKDEQIKRLTSSHQSARDALTNELEEARASRKDLEQEALATTSSLEAKTQEYDTLVVKFNALTTQQANTRSRMDKVRAERDEHATTLRRVQTERDALKNELEAVKDIRDQYKALSEEMSNKLRDSSSLKADFKKATADEQRRREEWLEQKHEKEISDWEDRFAEQNREMEIIKEEKYNQWMQLTEVHALYKGAQDRITEINVDLTRKRNQVDNLKSQISTYREQTIVGDSEFEQLQNKFNSHKAEMGLKQAACDKLQMDLDSLRDEHGRLQDQIRQGQADQDQDAQKASLSGLVMRELLSRLGGGLPNAESILAAFVADADLVRASTAPLSPSWTILQTEAVQNVPDEIFTWQMAILCLASAAAEGKFSSPWHRRMLKKLTQQMTTLAPIPAHVLIELAQRVANCLSNQMDDSFEFVLGFWQLMTIVEQRLPTQPPRGTWAESRDQVVSHLQTHQYAPIFDMMAGKEEPHANGLCRAFNNGLVMCLGEHWLRVVVIDTNLRTMRFFEKSHWQIKQQEVVLPAMDGQEAISIPIDDAIVNRILGFN